MISYIIYLIKNITTEKVYIGYTKYSLEKRWKQHCNRAKKQINTPFYNAIRKYGEENWNKYIICECNSVDEVKQKEIELIAEHNSYNDGYNATIGGDGNRGIKMSSESNIKRSFALKGKLKNYLRMHGKKHTKETIEKMRKPKKDKSKYNTEKFKNMIRERQAKISKKRRQINKEQYESIFCYIAKGYSKKKISQILNISYDLVKKWSLRSWE